VTGVSPITFEKETSFILSPESRRFGAATVKGDGGGEGGGGGGGGGREDEGRESEGAGDEGVGEDRVELWRKRRSCRAIFD